MQLKSLPHDTSFALFTKHDLTHCINFRVKPVQQVPSFSNKMRQRGCLFEVYKIIGVVNDLFL